MVDSVMVISLIVGLVAVSLIAGTLIGMAVANPKIEAVSMDTVGTDEQ